MFTVFLLIFRQATAYAYFRTRSVSRSFLQQAQGGVAEIVFGDGEDCHLPVLTAFSILREKETKGHWHWGTVPFLKGHALVSWHSDQQPWETFLPCPTVQHPVAGPSLTDMLSQPLLRPAAFIYCCNIINKIMQIYKASGKHPHWLTETWSVWVFPWLSKKGFIT